MRRRGGRRCRLSSAWRPGSGPGMRRAAASSTTRPPASRRTPTRLRLRHCGSPAWVRFQRAARRGRPRHPWRRCRCLDCVGRYSSCRPRVACLSGARLREGSDLAPARQDTMRAGRDEMRNTVLFGITPRRHAPRKAAGPYGDEPTALSRIGSAPVPPPRALRRHARRAAKALARRSSSHQRRIRR